MADLATLQIKVDAGEATRAVQLFGTTADRAAASTVRLQASVAGLSSSSAQRAAAFKAETARLAELGRRQQDTANDFKRTAATISGGFGVGGLATLAVVGFAVSAVNAFRQARAELKALEEQQQRSLRVMAAYRDLDGAGRQVRDVLAGDPRSENRSAQLGLLRLREFVDAERARIESGAETRSRIAQQNEIRRFRTLEGELARMETRYGQVQTVFTELSRLRQEQLVTLASLESQAADAVDRQATAYERLAAAATLAGRALSTGQRDHRGRVIGLDASIPTGGFGRTGYLPGDPVMGLPAGVGMSAPGVSAAAAYSASIVAAFAEADDEIAKNFRENMQRSLGDFFGEFVSTGRLSIRDLFSGLQGIGGQLAGQAISGYLTPKFDSLSTGQQIGVGSAIAGLGMLTSAFIASGEQARATAQAFRDTRRSVEDFGRYARDAFLSPEERQRAAFDDRREVLRQQGIDALRESGINVQGLTGNIPEDIELLRRMLAGLNGIPGQTNLRNALQELIAVFAELEVQFNANIVTAEKLAAVERVRALTSTIDSLQSFQRNLRQSDLSIYNPFQQASDAEAEYRRILALAESGDQGAASQYQSAARNFLEQSRGINASGSRYVADFQRVEADTARMQALFEAQRSTEEDILSGLDRLGDETRRGNENTDRIGDETRRGREAAEAYLTVSQAGFGGTIERLDMMITEQQGMRRDLTLGLERLEALERAA